MLEIDRNQNITLTRGDTAYIDVTGFQNNDGESYTLIDGDKVYFRLGTNPILEKELTLDLINNKAVLHLVPADTMNLPYSIFKFEVEVVTSIGDHYTCVADKNFTISKEVEVHNGN